MKQLFFLLMAAVATSTAYSQPGTLDLTFGNKGFVADNGISATYAVAQQKDGKLITAGGYNDAEFNPKGSLARFLPNGTIDSSFGVNGFSSGSAGPYDMVLQPDDKILIVGLIRDSINTQLTHYCVVRYRPDGPLDSSFGNNGIALIPDFEDNTQYNRIRLASDGSIIIAGDGYSADRQERYSFLSRVTANGVFDAKFGGTNGRVINYTALTDEGLTIQKDGRMLLAGYSRLIFETSLFHQAFVLSRYTPDGFPDETFGTNGTVITEGIPSIEENDQPGGIVVQPDGKIILGGASYDYNLTNDMTAIRYNSDGTLDNSFGTKGKAFVSFGNKTARVTAVLLQPDGKVILSGDASDLTESGLALCRFNANGTPDSSFGIDGVQITSYSGGGDAGTLCALLQQDGKIVQGGSYYNTEQEIESYLLARYNNDSKGQNPLVARIKRFLHNHGIGWQGLDNKDVNYYSVQYSTTGSGFAEKGKVSGAGSNSFQQYNFNITDAGYYRVVAVDRKGYKTFSNKVMVSQADLTPAASVYPNPAKEYVTVQGLPATETANISISDGSGNVKVKGVSTSSQYQSRVNQLQPGTYYVNITTGTKTETLKFVKE